VEDEDELLEEDGEDEDEDDRELSEDEELEASVVTPSKRISYHAPVPESSLVRVIVSALAPVTVHPVPLRFVSRVTSPAGQRMISELSATKPIPFVLMDICASDPLSGDTFFTHSTLR